MLIIQYQEKLWAEHDTSILPTVPMMTIVRDDDGDPIVTKDERRSFVQVAPNKGPMCETPVNDPARSVRCPCLDDKASVCVPYNTKLRITLDGWRQKCKACRVDYPDKPNN